MQAAAVVGLGLQAASMLTQGSARSAEAKQQASAATFNAAEQERQAADIRRSGAFELDQQQREARQTAGRLRSAIGSSGFEASGSLARLERDSAVQAELDALAIRYNTETQATGRVRQAGAYRAEASGYRKNARASMIGGILGAGATVAGGYATMKAGA